jgi:hypothetical protein
MKTHIRFHKELEVPTSLGEHMEGRAGHNAMA